jgi:hypothetical protein
MSRNGDTIQSLGGEERPFRFGLAEHRRLQEALGDKMGLSLIVQNLHPFVTATAAGFTLDQIILSRLLGDLRLEQIGEVIFQGLIGGGMSPPEAGKLRKTWVDERPIIETAPIAYAVGLAALVGPEDENAAGESKGGEAEPPSQTGKSGSAKTGSTRSGTLRAATRRKRSTE